MSDVGFADVWFKKA